MKENQNKVIIIGTDHHNVLGTVRCFGVNRIKPYGIIVKNDDSPLWVTKSRYWEKTWVIDSDEKISEVLIDNFSEEEHKPVIICCSDGAMSHIDNNINQLSQYFILPSFNNEQGAITRLMNKETQSEFLKKYGIKTLESKIINLSDNLDNYSFEYPIILKPVASIEGNKKDITICWKRDDLLQAIYDFNLFGYKRILVQNFVTTIVEYQLTGSISKNIISFTVCQNLRQWPLKTGSGSFSKLIKEGNILRFSEITLSKLQRLGFYGPIDIELFEINNEYYVNEINWRSSGRVYVNLANKVYSTLYYYLDLIDRSDDFSYYNNKQFYAINEGTDIRNVFISRTIPLHKWIIQLFMSKSYSLWYWSDLKPTFERYKYYIRKFITKTNRG